MDRRGTANGLTKLNVCHQILVDPSPSLSAVPARGYSSKVSRGAFFLDKIYTAEGPIYTVQILVGRVTKIINAISRNVPIG